VIINMIRSRMRLCKEVPANEAGSKALVNFQIHKNHLINLQDKNLKKVQKSNQQEGEVQQANQARI
jgi:hypothetical protein